MRIWFDQSNEQLFFEQCFASSCASSSFG